MKAVVLDEERRLELRDVPDPEPSEGQTLVRVRAAGVNYADVLIREGRYPQTPKLPFVPGSEIAGETGDGRRVIGFVRAEGGGYAEQAVAEDEWLFDLKEFAFDHVGLSRKYEGNTQLARKLDPAIHEHVDPITHGVDDFGQLVE